MTVVGFPTQQSTVWESASTGFGKSSGPDAIEIQQTGNTISSHLAFCLCFPAKCSCLWGKTAEWNIDESLMYQDSVGLCFTKNQLSL